MASWAGLVCPGCGVVQDACGCPAVAGFLPGAGPGSVGPAEGSSETGSAQTVNICGSVLPLVDVEAFVAEAAERERTAARELEGARRECARLREELKEARAAQADFLQAKKKAEEAADSWSQEYSAAANQRDAARVERDQLGVELAAARTEAGAAAERAWVLEQKLAVAAGPRVRELLEKNSRTIRALREHRLDLQAQVQWYRTRDGREMAGPLDGQVLP